MFGICWLFRSISDVQKKVSPILIPDISRLPETGKNRTLKLSEILFILRQSRTSSLRVCGRQSLESCSMGHGRVDGSAGVRRGNS